jgi:hypothetical protein
LTISTPPTLLTVSSYRQIGAEIPDSSSVSSRPPPSEAFEPFELFELLLALVGDAVGAGVGAPVGALIETFDIESYSDFSAK